MHTHGSPFSFSSLFLCEYVYVHTSRIHSTVRTEIVHPDRAIMLLFSVDVVNDDDDERMTVMVEI